MPTKLPDLPRVTLRGPFWTAEAELVQLAQPSENWAFRTLLLAPGFFRLANQNVRPPGTLLVLCWVRSVTLRPDGDGGVEYAWRRASGEKPPARPAPDSVLGQVAQGGLALLLVQPDPSAWSRQGEDNPGANPAFAPLRVLAGDISLDPLAPQAGARDRVYAACGLRPAVPGAERAGAARLLGQVTVHASGVSLFGTAALPWEPERVSAPFLLAQRLPASGGFRVEVEEERLTAGERDALVAAWGRLEAAVNPGRPRSGDAGPAPAWVTLEVADPTRPPRMHWEMEAWDEGAARLTLRFARGEFTVLLADQQPYAEGAGPTSLARIVPDSPSITLGGGSLRIEAGLGAAQGAGGTLRYLGDGDAPEWEETFTLAAAPLAFSAVEAPRQVRDAQALPVPEWFPPRPARPGEEPDRPRPVEPPVVWGFAPLADGWAQLPVPNLTEQIYLDAGLARPPSPDEAREAPVLQGAVSFGNERPGAPEVRGAEQPWSLTLTSAAGMRGTWTLDASRGGFRLARVELEVRAPELVLNGLFWLSTEPPTLADALPGLDDWVAGLRPVSLNTVRPGAEVFPPVVVTPVGSLAFSLRRTGTPPAGTVPFPTAALHGWTLGYDADGAVFGALVEKGVLPADTFSRHLPLVWRRHAALPMVQALPLTQSLSPPTHPSRSRQLAPFELRATQGARPLPDGWRFGVEAAAPGEGAARWPRLLSGAAAAGAWRGEADLPLVSLSLPGLVLDPRADPGAGVDGGLGLPLQYRWDLPYTDEPNALAQLPRVPSPPASTPQLDGAEPRPQPLTRETLAAHWHRLSARASLAAVDAATAFRTEGGALVVRNLVEPLPWPVAAGAELDAYPGTLTLRNAQDPPAPLALSGDDALRGVRGRWAEAGGALRRLGDGEAAAVAYEVEAGSMAAARAADGTFRDQRGLFRGATAVGSALLRTPVRLHESAGPHVLTSSLAPFALHAAAGRTDGGWALWFRDLPARGGVFRRDEVLSDAGLDVNDPHAGDREHNALNGWEWRLGVGDGGYAELFGLHFYPLTLDRVDFADDAPARVEVTGRLQLPLAGGGELPDFTNAVRLAFVRDAASGRLVLDSAAPADAGAVTEWPLALREGEGVEAPRLEWTGISFHRAAGALRVAGGRLRFFLFGAEWSVPLAELVFTRDGPPIDQTYAVEGGDAGGGVEPRTLGLRIDVAGRAHTVSLLLAVRLGKEPGDGGGAAPAAGDAGRPPGTGGNKGWRLVEDGAAAPSSGAAESAPGLERAVFDAEVRLHLLEAGGPAAAAGEPRAEWVAGRLFEDLELPETWSGATNRRLTGGGLALQFAWDHAGVPGRVPPLQLLPGMHVGRNEAPGFAALSFTVAGDGDVPSLRLATGFVEALLHCRWGAFLQEPPVPGDDPLRRVFGSSAGDLAFGYTGERVGDRWTESVLLNGFVEVKDLVSWPAALARGSDGKVTLPAARGRQPLAHVRHTLRILFNQHTIPSAVLRTGEGGLLFDLRDDASWQFLAVTEHQLVNVTPSAALDAAAVGHDRRWTAVQEVRLATPPAFKRFLAGLTEQKALDPVDGVDTVGGSSAGWSGAGMRTRLAQGTSAELDRLDPATLVVEASAVHWIRQHPVATPSATTLQYLPQATQLAVPSRPEDFGPSDPRDPQWLLLATPFLGRLQDEARDGVYASPPGAPALQVDPVLALGRARAASAALPDVPLALAGWGDAAPVTIAVSGLDTAPGRLWARLDPLSLEESWFRLQNPLDERPPERLPSVLASLPATAARLGRAVALTRAFQALRATYPPERPDEAPEPQDLVGGLVWRPDRLFVIQGVSDQVAGSTPYGWVLTGAQLLTSALWAAEPDAYGGRRTFPAATLLATLPGGEGAPLPLAVSPFLGLDLRPALGRFDPRLVYAELLCLNGGTGALLPVASVAWELKGGLTREDVGELAQGWARETHGRLAPDSPVAVLRFREVCERTSPPVGDEAVLTTRYRFDVVRGLARPAPLARRVFRVRSDVGRLRFRDGRFGSRIPAGVRPLELAPPQTVGVQPLHLARRPDAATAGTWPWGMSALSVSVRYTAGALPAIGPSGEAAPQGEATLWWQAPQHRVQFRSPTRAEGPTAGLPPHFRAPAIRGLLPVVPDAPLPAVDARQRMQQGPALERWQPVLPGALRYLLLGARAGAMLSLRHQLLRQSGLSFDPAEAAKRPAGEGMTSGSVPAHHRVPRPVPLPRNDPASPDTALRTWASRYHPEESVRATPAPSDEGWFAAGGGLEARRIRLTLRAPGFGAVGAGWDGALLFDAAFGSAEDGIARWSVALEAADGEAVYGWEPPVDEGGGGVRFALRDTALLARVAAKRPGETLRVRARVAPDTAAAGFFQTLSFVLRMAEGAAVPPPLEPRFFHFEDPEYDRRLASAAAHASGMVQTVDTSPDLPARPLMRTATLAADRRMYNPDGILSLRWDWDDDHAAGSATVTAFRIDTAGVPLPLEPVVGGLAPGELVQLSLSALRYRGQPLRLSPGDVLRLRLRVPVGGRVAREQSIYLSLDVVAEPVQPVPEAAYALLKRDGGAVECARFAWAPEPARVELVNPADLRVQVVRRRAVFHWTDTVRRASAPGYEVQKIAATGSTYTPRFETMNP